MWFTPPERGAAWNSHAVLLSLMHPPRTVRLSPGIASGQSVVAFKAPYAFVPKDGYESAEQESPTEVAFAQEIVHHEEWADESLMRDGSDEKFCLPSQDTRFYSSPRGVDPGSGDIYPCGAGFQGDERLLIKFQRSPCSENMWEDSSELFLRFLLLVIPVCLITFWKRWHKSQQSPAGCFPLFHCTCLKELKHSL